MTDAVLADWITLSPESQNRAGVIQKKVVVQAQQNTEEKSQKVNSVNEPTQIVEAQGWVIDQYSSVKHFFLLSVSSAPLRYPAGSRSRSVS
ncbi:hypothetical protein KBT16_32565 [Nostoc sp. CCCryo 231-06]|nr:hypothetical protein [Nostoc sp. CCCryo 231-06]